MRQSMRVFFKYTAIVCPTLLVVLGLWQCQRPARLVDVGPHTYPPTRSVTTHHGWPLYWLLRQEITSGFPAGPVHVTYNIESYALAANTVAWIVVILATLYISWRTCLSQARFRLTFIVSATSAIAILLSLWRIERIYHTIPGEPDFTHMMLLLPDTPILRLLQLSAPVCVSVFLGLGCLVLSINLIIIQTLSQAVQFVKLCWTPAN